MCFSCTYSECFWPVASLDSVALPVRGISYSIQYADSSVSGIDTG